MHSCTLTDLHWTNRKKTFKSEKSIGELGFVNMALALIFVYTTGYKRGTFLAPCLQMYSIDIPINHARARTKTHRTFNSDWITLTRTANLPLINRCSRGCLSAVSHELGIITSRVVTSRWFWNHFFLHFWR